jgi:hypothetical protein
MKKIKKLLLLLVAVSFVQGALLAQNITFGLQQDEDNLLSITVVAYPDFYSDNITVSSAVVSLLLPEGIETTSSIDVAPVAGSFENIMGSWSVQRITPDLYASVGFEAADLEGHDIYQVVLQNAPELYEIANNNPIPLFTFELTGDCNSGSISILNNQSSIQQSIVNNLRANFNNQMSMSIDDAPSRDLYVENDPFTSVLDCPLDGVVSSTSDLNAAFEMNLQPNPTVEYLNVVLNNNMFSDIELEIYDVSKVVHYRQQYQLAKGINNIHLEVIEQLAPGTYFLKVSNEDNTYQEKFIKVNY